MPDQDGNLNRHLYAQTHQHGRDDRHHHHHRHHHQHSDRHHDHAKVQCPPDPFPEDVTAPPKDASDTSPKPPSRLPSNLSCGSREADWNWCPGRLQIISQGDPQKRELAIICLRGKEQKVCRRSLFIFSLNSCFRRHVIELVNWFLFDKFILSFIIFNSLCLASYDYRSESDSGFNWISDNVFDPILTCFFTLEFVLKVIAFGFVLDETSYLRDAWNWLDFIVVVTGTLQMTNAMTSTEGVGFLRMFRILRPLRSLNAVPQMKVLVNTVLSSVPRLGNVTLMAAFLFVSFGILGISLFGGVFYRSCRSIAQPLLLGSNGTECWSWPYTGEERLCGGRYLCEDSPLGQKGHCGGHPQDTNEEFRPVFDGGQRGFPWCSGSEPRKVFPESEWISFDHLGTALITIFQCMTLEGWTDVMYRIQDGYGFAVATIYFFLLIPVTSFFLLNVALAVVDEAREDFAVEAEEEALEEEALQHLAAEAIEESEVTIGSASRASRVSKMHAPRASGWMGQLVDAAEDVTRAMSKALDAEQVEEEEVPWLDTAVVRILRYIATSEAFTNLIMLFIALNVVTMMLDGYPPILELQDFLATCEIVFLVIFCIEMCILLGAYGPCRYVRTPAMCFDGIIVTVSVVQVLTSPDGQGGPFTALRTFRLFRVLNKLASRWPSFRVLLKAMLYTGKSLSYWIVLFSLVLYICTLMFMQLFNRKFHFLDVDSLAEVGPDQGQAWCEGTDGLAEPFRQDCIPRANFDTFLWSLVSIFQIMTGENWNTIMYAGMRAQGWAFGGFFVGLIVFGQILFLSLFLSMLLSKFDEVQDEMEQKEAEKMSKSKNDVGTHSLRSLFRAVSTLRKIETWRDAGHEKKVAPVGEETTSDMKPVVPKAAGMEALGELPEGESSNSLKRTLVWPRGYALCIFSENHAVRRLCKGILSFEAFCSEGVSSEVAQQCRVNCQGHPFFCKESCEADEQSGTCQSCRRECEAACECSNFCEPLIKDAALCVEQGGRWQQALSQDFDNVFSSMLTLFEISSTEGWADVMYAACDSVGHFIEPIRNYSEWMFAPFFVVYMIFSNMFIINLSVGVIVDKFMDLKQSGKRDVILTSAQVKWLDSQKLLSRTCFFDVQDLDMMPPLQRKAYDIISSFRFTTFIMVAIALNSALMAMQTFPSQIEWWADVMYVGKRVFSGIFTLEMMLKFYALRCTYFEDSWNRFDFFCVVVSLLGIVLEDTTTLNVTGVTSVFRVLRLFRLMKYLRGVKKIFAALAASVPKLVNVMAILLLLLTLYSILGVSLFSTLKFSSENAQCNFKDFVQAFITLFRASTGEAWNEIMHDIARSPRQIFASGDWCTPDYLFDPENHFEVLSEKCLIDRPNGCVNSWIMGQLMPLTYWVTYTLIVAIMVMNLVIAVILESYEEGKGEKDTEIVEHCVKLWKQRDTDLKMYLPMEEAIAYIAEALNYGMELHQEENRMPIAMPELISKRLTEVPMKFINTLDLPCTEDGKVYFWHALVQVLKLLCHRWDPTLINEINSLEEMLDPDMAEKLKMDRIWESRKRQMQQAPRESILSVKDHIAALKIQHIVRDRRVVRVPSESEVPKGRNHAFQDVVS